MFTRERGLELLAADVARVELWQRLWLWLWLYQFRILAPFCIVTPLLFSLANLFALWAEYLPGYCLEVFAALLALLNHQWSMGARS